MEEIQSKKNKGRTRIEKADARNWASVTAMAVIGLYALTLMFLFFWGVFSSVRHQFDFFENPFGFRRDYGWRFINYVRAFTELHVPVTVGEGRNAFFPEMFFWSLITSVFPTIVNVLTAAICSYTLAKYKFRLRAPIFNTLIIVMILPIIGSLPANLQLLRAIGVFDQLWWVIFSAGTVWASSWLILYAVYKSVSWDFAEAAFIDGAGHHRVFWSMMLPLTKTVIFVLILLGFIGAWNNFQLTLIWLPSYPTLAFGLFYLQGTSGQDAWATTQLAMAIISAVPAFILFMLFKKKMMGALTMGGLKG